MKFNKTLAAALLLGFTLTGCNNVVDNNKDAKEGDSPVVEENKKDDVAEETTKDEETVESTDADTKEATDEDASNTETETEAETTDSDDDTDSNTEEDATAEEESETATTDTSNMSVEEKKEVLEQAIFDNRSQARAAELLLELTPEKVSDIAPQLNQLIDESNALLEKAQQALDQLNAQ